MELADQPLRRCISALQTDVERLHMHAALLQQLSASNEEMESAAAVRPGF